MRTVCRLALVVLALAAGTLRVSAQTCGNKGNGSFTLTVTPTSSTVTPTSTDFNAGFSQTSTYTVTVTPAQTNKFWALCIYGVGNMGTVNGYTKPITDMQYSVNGGAWTTLTTALTQIASAKVTTTLTIATRSVLAYANDQPSSYNPTVPFTYVANWQLNVSY